MWASAFLSARRRHMHLKQNIEHPELCVCLHHEVLQIDFLVNRPLIFLIIRELSGF